jgi:hypothetical protein
MGRFFLRSVLREAGRLIADRWAKWNALSTRDFAVSKIDANVETNADPSTAPDADATGSAQDDKQLIFARFRGLRIQGNSGLHADSSFA